MRITERSLFFLGGWHGRRIFGMGSTDISRLGGRCDWVTYLSETQECCYFRVMLYRSFRVATNAISFVRILRRFESR